MTLPKRYSIFTKDRKIKIYCVSILTGIAVGKTGEKVSAVGLGYMGMSAAYGGHNDEESIATLNPARWSLALISGTLRTPMRTAKMRRVRSLKAITLAVTCG